MKKIFLFTCQQLFKFPIPKKIHNFLMWPIATRVLGRDYDDVIDLKDGFKMHAYMGDYLGRCMIFYGKDIRYFWEPTTNRVVELLVKDKKTALTAGSHIGSDALHLQKAMGPEGKTYTFEPINTLARVAKKNIELNPELGQIVFVEKALGEENGEAEFIIDGLRSHVSSIEGTNDAGHDKYTADQVSIDNFMTSEQIDSLDLLLLDIEGVELEALRGASNALKQERIEDIIFEISHPKKDGIKNATDITNFLSQFGYSFYVIDETYDVIKLKKEPEKPQVVKISDTTDFNKFIDLSYFNVLGTKKSTADLTKMGLEIV